MLSIYEERGIAKGEAHGIAKGSLQGKRDVVLRLLRHKFGDLPDAVRGRIEAMESGAELDSLADAILDAATLQDLHLPGTERNGQAP